MGSRTPVFRWALRGSAVAVTGALAVAGLAGVAGAQDLARGAAATLGGPAGSTSRTPGGTGPAVNPYSPASGHSYRRGVVPTTGQLRLMRAWARENAALAGSRPAAARPSAGTAAATVANPANLSYGGGVGGVGVTSGRERVYLVFWGSQWGSKSADGHGDVTLAHDPSGEAPYLQKMFRGLGTGGEKWSGVMTQYCDGVRYGAMSCPPDSWHVGYPYGGALAGVWVDESRRTPVNATGTQLGAEAVAAAGHFGNTSKASNRDAQYVIASPTGAHPDGFSLPGGGFCAWHDDTADPTLPAGPVESPLDLAFTNLPYVTDLGLLCGQGFVNSGPAGLDDGVSIVAGHEYAETVTDQLPAFGWSSIGADGEENGDLCAWNLASTGNLALPTGTFAMQATWSNDAGGYGGCEFSHPVVTNNWVLNGGFDSGTFASWATAGTTAIVSSGAHTGKYAARDGAPGPASASSAIAQTFTARGTHLSFWYEVNCPDTVAQSWATATVTDNTAHTTTTVLAPTCAAHSGWLQVRYAVMAGHSYTLKLINHDDKDTASADGTYTLFDGVVDN